MALETGTYISNLTTTNPVTTDKRHQGDDHLRLIKTVVKNTFPDGDRAIYTDSDEVTVASNTTTDILGAASNFIAISGTTTITSLGTGTYRQKFVRFSGALTLTHNATSLILPGGANITTVAGDTCVVISDGSSNARIYAFQRATDIELGTNHIQWGTWASSGSSGTGVLIDKSSAPFIKTFHGVTGATEHVAFHNENGKIGTISLSSSTTTYNTSSDYRLKTNYHIMDNALERLQELKPYTGEFVAQPGVGCDYLIAHEVQGVVPQAVQGFLDQVDEKGAPVYQSMDYSKLVPLLVASVQELTKRVHDLEGKA